MMNLAQPESAIVPARINIRVVRVAAAIGLAALADWLFYDEYAGLSVVIFAVALAVVSLATNLETADRRRDIGREPRRRVGVDTADFVASHAARATTPGPTSTI